jgi:hypothetical protein
MTHNNDMIIIYPIWYMNSGYVQYSFLYSRIKWFEEEEELEKQRKL